MPPTKFRFCVLIDGRDIDSNGPMNDCEEDQSDEGKSVISYADWCSLEVN